MLNPSPTNANTGKAPPIEMLANVPPALNAIVVFGSPCSVYRDQKKNNFAKRAQRGVSFEIGDDTKGYQVFLPKDRIVITTQHIRDIETLNKEQNELLLRHIIARGIDAKGIACTEANKNSSDVCRRSDNPVWSRARVVTRSMGPITIQKCVRRWMLILEW